MAQTIVMPKLGLTMEKATVLSWLKREGDSVDKGEAVLEIESDKIVNEVISPATGILMKIIVEEGQEAEVRTVLGIVGEHGEDITELEEESLTTNIGLSSAPASQRSEEPGGKQNKPEKTIGQARQRITPRARKFLIDRGLDPSIMNSVQKERITEADVKVFLKTSEADKSSVSDGEPGGTLKSLSQVQRIVADRMTESFRNIPQFSLRFQANVNYLLDLVSQFKKKSKVKITINDMIIRAVALTLARYPDAQNQYKENGIWKPASIDLGVAMDAGGELLVPVIRGADKKKITELARELRNLVQKTKSSKLVLKDLEGATFTVSNLGMYGIISFIPIVVPGQAAILGVGAMHEIPEIEGGKLRTATSVEFTLVCDHRSVNGVVGATFCREFTKIIETEEASSW